MFCDVEGRASYDAEYGRPVVGSDDGGYWLAVMEYGAWYPGECRATQTTSTFPELTKRSPKSKKGKKR